MSNPHPRYNQCVYNVLAYPTDKYNVARTIPGLKPKSHARAEGVTKHMSLRVPAHVAAALESDSARLGISVSSLSNSILGRWARWDRHVQKLGMVAVPKAMFSMIVPEKDEREIRDLVDSILPFFQEAVILMKGKYDLKRCIETLEDYMRTTQVVSDHTVDGSVHRFTIQHGMGMFWSVFTKMMLERLFSEFVPDKKVEYDVRENIVSVSIPLGSDWDEHDY